MLQCQTNKKLDSQFWVFYSLLPASQLVSSRTTFNSEMYLTKNRSRIEIKHSFSTMKKLGLIVCNFFKLNDDYSHYTLTFDSIVHLLMLIMIEILDCIFHFEDKKSKQIMKLRFGPKKKK